MVTLDFIGLSSVCVKQKSVFMKKGQQKQVSPEDPSSQSRFVDAPLSPEVQQALSGLDCEFQRVLDSAYGLTTDSAGGTPEQIAEELGTTTEAVKALQENALRSLYAPK